MRTFVALNLPGTERERLHAALEPLRSRRLNVRWIGAAALHVTVKFLGETDGSSVERVQDVLRHAASRHSTITLRIAGVGAFPSLRRANIVWMGVAPDAELNALQRELEPALSRLGFPREQRPFRPHITVGRAERNTRAPDIERLAGLVTHEAEVTVNTIDLMLSRPGAGGSTYEALLRCPLGVGART
ncbi:MAG TPA: RNA 2',3'-cyclic phosphodiesterase [Longimicrobiales bacterium]